MKQDSVGFISADALNAARVHCAQTASIQQRTDAWTRTRTRKRITRGTCAENVMQAALAARPKIGWLGYFSRNGAPRYGCHLLSFSPASTIPLDQLHKQHHKKAASQHSTQFCITLQETTLRLFTCRPAPLLPRRCTPSLAAVSDEHGLRWRPRVPPRDGGMFEADLSMGVFNAEHEMAKRNASLTLVDLKN